MKTKSVNPANVKPIATTMVFILIGALFLSGCEDNADETTQSTTQPNLTTTNVSVTTTHSSITQTTPSQTSSTTLQSTSQATTFKTTAQTTTATKATTTKAPASEIKVGTIYETSDYYYVYGASNSSLFFDTPFPGWSVQVKDNAKESYEPILSEIQGMPVTHLVCTFQGCYKMKESPVIPSTITDMTWAYRYATGLKVAPVIPASVKKMGSAFVMTSLEGEIVCNANPTEFMECFSDVAGSLKIVGSCTLETKKALAQTANLNNVTY